MTDMAEIDDQNQILIRQMTENDISGALQVFASHGLYESKNSVKTYLHLDCNAFYVAIDLNSDRVIGVCGGPILRPESAFIGLYGVDKQYFGRRIGQKLFNTVMEYIGDRNCGLFSMPDKIPLYKDRLGFKFIAKHKMVIYFGKRFDNFDKSNNNYSKLQPILTDQMIEDIIDYDQQIHRYRREKLLKLSLREADCLALAALDLNTNMIVGYGCIRQNSSMSAVLSPVYANSYEIAKQLIENLINSYEIALKNGVFYYTIDTDSGLRIGEDLQLERHEECLLLYNKYIVDIDYQKVFAILSPDFSL